MKSFSQFLILLMSLILSTTVTHAADIKVGYVQVDKILREAPQTTETGKKLEKEFSPRSTELARLQKKIKALEASLDRERKGMTDVERRRKERDTSNLKLDFQRKQRELREDINLRKNEELAILQNRINKAVTTVAETEKFDLVVYGGVAYASKKIDLTDKVLKLLGKK